MARALVLAVAALVAAGGVRAAAQERPSEPRAGPPAGTEVLGFENLEGVMLVSATLRSVSGSDTTVRLVLDTGAGYVALDYALAAALGLEDSTAAERGAADRPQGIRIAARALPRMRLETLEMDHLSPVLVFDTKVIREVTDRPVDGLIGQSIFNGRALQVDYRTHTLAIIPVPPSTAEADEREAREGAPMGEGARSDDRAGSRTGNRASVGADSAAAGSRPPEPPGGAFAKRSVARSRVALESVLSAKAVPIPFELAGDGKILVRARVSNAEPPHFSRSLTLVLDTGATKCVFFADALERMAPRSRIWRSLSGLAAPTLFGTAEARIVRIPAIQVASERGAVTRTDVDAAVMRSDLAEVLSQAVEAPVHGLLGYSFLKHYRLTIDYPHRVVWLEPQPARWDERPYEYSHVGMQLARVNHALRVIAVVEGSPAARAGIQPGDQLRSLDGHDVADLDVAEASRELEGPPGTMVTLKMRRGEAERTYRLVRRWLM